MKTQHTPGPWATETVASYGDTVSVTKNGLRSKIAVTSENWLCEEHGGTAKANARLIAAAPDLLSALEACLTDDGAAAERSHTMACRRLAAINEICRAAIAKARGEA